MVKFMYIKSKSVNESWFYYSVCVDEDNSRHWYCLCNSDEENNMEYNIILEWSSSYTSNQKA